MTSVAKHLEPLAHFQILGIRLPAGLVVLEAHNLGTQEIFMTKLQEALRGFQLGGAFVLGGVITGLALSSWFMDVSRAWDSVNGHLALQSLTQVLQRLERQDSEAAKALLQSDLIMTLKNLQDESSLLSRARYVRSWKPSEDGKPVLKQVISYCDEVGMFQTQEFSSNRPAMRPVIEFLQKHREK